LTPSEAGGSVFRFSRTPFQVDELRALCAEWQHGPSPAQRFWSFDDVLAALTRPGSVAMFHAAHEEAPWNGVALIDVGPYTADLLYIYIRPTCRRRGIGKALMRAIAAELATRPQLETLFLEVRTSNVEAQALYANLGMELVGKRQRYYSDGEDAIIFKMALR
jgi:ribosomal protein S18 acetylase RimI-like enzyme